MSDTQGDGSMMSFVRMPIAAVALVTFATLGGCAAPVEDPPNEGADEAEQPQGSDETELDTMNASDAAPDSNIAVIIGGGGHRAGAHRARAYQRSPFYPGNPFHRRGPWRRCDAHGRCW
jgi:hypothetical protein